MKSQMDHVVIALATIGKLSEEKVYEIFFEARRAYLTELWQERDRNAHGHIAAARAGLRNGTDQVEDNLTAVAPFSAGQAMGERLQRPRPSKGGQKKTVI